MPAFQNSELLPKGEIFQNEAPVTAKEAHEWSGPEVKQVEHDKELYQIRIGGVAVSHWFCDGPGFWRTTAIKDEVFIAVGNGI
jgi:hypothetical protein